MIVVAGGATHSEQGKSGSRFWVAMVVISGRNGGVDGGGGGGSRRSQSPVDGVEGGRVCGATWMEIFILKISPGTVTKVELCDKSRMYHGFSQTAQVRSVRSVN